MSKGGRRLAPCSLKTRQDGSLGWLGAYKLGSIGWRRMSRIRQRELGSENQAAKAGLDWLNEKGQESRAENSCSGPAPTDARKN